MSSTKMVFSVEEVGRLRTKIGLVSQDTNRLYMQFRGQASSWSGLPLGSKLQHAQVFINELTTEAEKLEDLIRTAVQGIQSVQEENKRRADQLTGQFTAVGGLFNILGGSLLAGRLGLPAFAQTAVLKLISSVSTLSGRDELSRDPAVQKLQGLIKTSTLGSVDWFTAKLKLAGIFEARNQIAKAQTAYAVYQAFGNRIQMEAVHQSAQTARKKLESLGVNQQLLEPGKDWSGYFKQSAVKACDYDPSITTGAVPLLQDESYLLLLRMAMEPGIPGEWAQSQLPAKRLEVQLAEAAQAAAAQLAAEQRLAEPPLTLPDGTPITAKNKENETTLAYFMDKVYKPNAQLTPMYTMYLGWLEDTYGMTEWRKKVVRAGAVAMAFTESLVKETVTGVVDTVKFAFRLVVDPEQTTREVLDQANYLINHPEVLVEAAKTLYHNFEDGTPEEKASMLGAAASALLPAVSVTKVIKAGKIIDGARGLVVKGLAEAKNLGKVLHNSGKLPNLNLNPFLTTPEGFVLGVGKSIPDTNPLLKNPVQKHDLREMDGLGDGKAGRVEGTGKGGANLTVPSLPNGSKPKGNYGLGDSHGIKKQNETADLLTDQGYDIKMLDEIDGGNGHGKINGSNPDFLIEGNVFDCYAPKPDGKVQSIIKEIAGKTKKQSGRIVLNLDNFPDEKVAEITETILRKANPDGDLKRLEELILVKNGKIIKVFGG